MQSATKSKVAELQAIMTKMSLEVCCMAALPEFGVRWREVSRAVRNARLPMTSASVARVICRHVAKSLPADDVDDIVARLRLKLVATQTRTWHLVRLEGSSGAESPAAMVRRLPGRVAQALATSRARNMTPEVQTVMMGDLVYMSVRLVSAAREGGALYVAAPPGQPVALLSSLGAATLIKAAIAGLGYTEYTDAHLHGSDIRSLLRVSDPAWSGRAEQLARAPAYRPAPARARDGLDYTNRAYDEQYIDNIIGPDPPLLTHLNITTTASFFDPSRLNKQMRLVVDLRSADVAKTLRAWGSKGVLAPTSDFYRIYHQIKANKITYTREDDD